MQSQKSTAAAERKLKTVFQLDSPFTTIQWPDISPQNQDTILELLCSLLSPIGQHRTNHTTPSKGKRSQKRKRQEAKSGAIALQDDTPPPPEISAFVVVGLNSITRVLEVSSKNSKPAIFVNDTASAETSAEAPTPQDPESENPAAQTTSAQSKHFSVIFVPKSSQPSTLHAHLPQLVATASLAHPALPATKLVQLSTGSDARICEALGLPRASFVGIMEDAPHSKALIELIRECVPEIEVPWLREMKKGRYLPVKINAIETFAPVAKEKEKKSA